jgi:hypothetical protein
MAFRVEVLEDGSIQLMRPTTNGQNHFVRYESMENAMIVIKMFLRSDIEQAKKDRFVPQATKEAREAFEEMRAKTDLEITNLKRRD